MLDLRELERELSSTKNTLDAWAKQAVECGVSIRDAHHKFAQDQTGKTFPRHCDFVAQEYASR
jgi:hypothetical protein